MTLRQVFVSGSHSLVADANAIASIMQLLDVSRPGVWGQPLNTRYDSL